jgi:protease II
MIVQQASQHITYPLTHLDTSDDIYHGIVVADPYRWLEDDNDIGNYCMDRCTTSSNEQPARIAAVS